MLRLSCKFSGIVFFIFIILSLCHFNIPITNASTEFDFGTLAISSLKLLGDAHMNNGSVRLTGDLPVPNSGAGKVLYSSPVKFREPGTHFPASFSTFFTFSVTNLNPSSIGGGLAFVISPDDDTVGDAGGFLGLVNETGSPGGFLAVEFDTLMDVEFKDINGNHVGLDLNSMVSTQVADLDAMDIDLKSGDAVNAWIEYDGSSGVFNITVSYSNLKPKLPLLSFSLDLDQYVNDLMYVGFSGSTQGSTEIHSIQWWSFSSSFDSTSGSSEPLPPPPPTTSFMNTPATVRSPPPSIAPSKSDSESSTATSQKNTLFAGAFIWFYSKKVKHVRNPDSVATDIIKTPREFSYKQIKSATKCFNANRIIGHGAFGTVYKGILPETGDIIAVKRCSHNGQGKNEFLSELSIIGTLRHRNLVRLQVASGRRPIEKDVSTAGKVGVCSNLVEWVWSLHREGRLLSAADARLGGEFDEGEMLRVLMVGLACSHPDPLARPTMRGVVQMLVGEAEVPIVPRAKPSMSFSTSHLLLSLQDSVSDCNAMINISTSSSENDFNGIDLV
ncbi:hypothetical protein CMV_019354 [Castanea mollissima]|uniref:Protein kinase domain-containing protein n=1 Tax=Castanea mollissima TaxID=60419 RepID=A0A8J4QJX7_9ROSI|nr:hypothetical protein CMV_019354 [Castanea mollissima]